MSNTNTNTSITVQEFAKAVQEAHGTGATLTYREFQDEMHNAEIDDIVDVDGEPMHALRAWHCVNAEIEREPLWLLRYADGRIADVLRAGTRGEALALHHESIGAPRRPWRGKCSECLVMTWAEFAASHEIPPDRGGALDMADELGIVIHDGDDYAENVETEDDDDWAEVAS